MSNVVATSRFFGVLLEFVGGKLEFVMKGGKVCFCFTSESLKKGENFSISFFFLKRRPSFSYSELGVQLLSKGFVSNSFVAEII